MTEPVEDRERETDEQEPDEEQPDLDHGSDREDGTGEVCGGEFEMREGDEEVGHGVSFPPAAREVYREIPSRGHPGAETGRIRRSSVVLATPRGREHSPLAAPAALQYGARPRRHGPPHEGWTMIRNSMFVLAVLDLESSATYYRDVLGFEITPVGDGDDWRFYQREGCRIMAGHCPDAIPPRELGDHSYYGYLIVEGIDGYYDRVVARGAEITKTLRDEPWGMREFGIRTSDGHRIMFGEDL